MMRSIFVLVTALTCAASCSNKSGTASGGADAASPSSASSGSAVWSKGQPVDAAVLQKVGEAVAECKVRGCKDYGIPDTCPAMKTWYDANNSLPQVESAKLDAIVAPKLLGHSAPAVRALGALYLSNLLGTDTTGGETIADAMGKETDPAVLGTMIRMAAPAAPKSAKVAGAIVAAAGHADKFVRFHAAVILANPKIAGSTPKMIELAEKDADKDVRGAACHGLAKHGDVALPTLDKLTKDTKSPDFGSCFEGLMGQWLLYPDFDTNSEKAYKLAVSRLEPQRVQAHDGLHVRRGQSGRCDPSLPDEPLRP